MTETGAVVMVEVGIVGAVGEVAVDIAVSATNPSSSKVSAIRGTNMQSKGRSHQRDIQIFII